MTMSMAPTLTKAADVVEPHKISAPDNDFPQYITYLFTLKYLDCACLFLHASCFLLSLGDSLILKMVLFFEGGGGRASHKTTYFCSFE